MKVVIFFLLVTVAKMLSQEYDCCMLAIISAHEQYLSGQSSQPWCSAVLSRNVCETLVITTFVKFSERGYRPLILIVEPDFYTFMLSGENNYSASLYVRLVDSHVTLWFLYQIFRIKHLNGLSLFGESAIQLSDKNDCICLSDVFLLQFTSVNQNVTDNFLLYCKDYFTSVYELYIQNLSVPNINLLTMFPTLQSLYFQMTNLTFPPQFPWYNLTRKTKLNITRQGFFNLIGSPLDMSRYPITIPPDIILRIYDLQFNPDINLENYHFSGYLHVLSLAGCRLTNLKDDIFISVTGLQSLDLSINNLESLRESLFTNLIDLRMLNIAFNMITMLPSNLFARQSKLVFLHISHNELDHLDSGIFANLINLEHVCLDNNFIRHIHRSAFDLNNINLKYISLKNNPISHFPYPLLYLPNLSNLDLQGHNISVLNFSDLFTNKTLNKRISRGLQNDNADYMSLSKRTINMTMGATKIISMSPNSPVWKIKYILKFHHILLQLNPLSCYCDIAPLLQIVKTLKNTQEISGQEHAFAAWRCTEPRDMIGKPLLGIKLTDLYCPLNLTNCPNRCKCFERFNISSMIVDCRYANLTETPSVLPPGQIELLLTSNRIEHFKMSVTQCASIVKLEIQDNSLKAFDHNCILSMEYLKVLYLNNNLISSIPNPIQDLNYLEEIQLGNNPYQCDCNFLWFKHWLIKNRNKIGDYTEVKCMNMGDDTGHTIYTVPDKDFICKEIHFNTVTSVIASVTSVIVICLLCTLLMYMNWQRFKVCLYIHTGMHPFDKADDDEDMPYDALVVYVSESEWVNTNIITPLGAEHGFKLVDCEKDFKFGVDQDRNIQDGISRSKRLLLIITPDSLSERLVRRTIEDALEKCRTQKSNYIILVFHNCSPADCKTEHLNRYIKGGIFVNTQQHNFLRRILYYMPKKKTMELVVHYKKSRLHTSSCEMDRQQLDTTGETSDITTALEYDDDETDFKQLDYLSSNTTLSDDSIRITGPIASQHAVEIHYMSCPELVIERPSPEGSVVFVWYADEDFQFMMSEIVRPLEEYGHTFILADKSFIPGASNQENILNAIERSNRTIIILSKESIVDELLLYTFRFASERHMSDDDYMMGLIVRGIVEFDCDEEVKKHLHRFTPLSDTDEWFSGKLRAFVKQHFVMNSKI